MPYEIPAEIEYKERIVFGLTFKQLIIALPFVFLIFYIFLRTNLDIYSKGFISILILFLAILFIFFELGNKIKTFINWQKNTILRTRNFNYYIGVKEIKDNYIYLPKNNRKVAILKIQPINFSIKTEEEKETIILQFQKFLNAIDFPIQILINTDTLDIKDYLNELKKRSNYINLFKKYKKFLIKTISNNSIKNRNFYLVIPEKHNIENQIEVCKKKLEELNLKVKRLDTKELETLINKFLIKEDKSIENKINVLKLNNKLNRVVYANGYPRTVEAGFLDRLISSIGNFDISLHIKPESIDIAMITLNKELQKQRADLYADEIKGILNPSLEIKYKDTKYLLENLQKGQDKLFDVSLYINVKADTLKELELLSRKVEAELNSLLIIPQIASYKMLNAYKSIVPIAENELKVNRNITTYSLSAFFPFTSPFLQLDNSGILLGLNKNNIPIIRDIFKLSNFNGLILASSGAGKSFFAKLLISRYLLNNTKVMVIDPQGEYKNLVKIFNGQLIQLNSKNMINPLDLIGHDYNEKRLSLMDLSQVLLGELTEPQKTFIDRALTEAYERKGINKDKETWNNEVPILEDVLEVLENYEKKAIRLEKTTLRSLINRLSMYVSGVFSFLNKHTNIDFNSDFVCFDIGDLPKQVKPVLMFLILDYVYMKMRASLERKLLVIDEAWSLLNRVEDASYIFEIVKTCRKFNLGLLLINQEVEGMLNSEAGKSVLANSSYTLLMRQKPAVIKDIEEVFHLSKMEKQVLLTASIGEGLLLIEDEHSEIKVIASEEEAKLITTNADEIMEQRKSNKKSNLKYDKDIKQLKSKVKNIDKEKPKNLLGKVSPKIDIKVDEEKGFYKHKELSLDEVKYLISKGYRESVQKSCFDDKKERYLLKPRFNENANHFFLTIDIANYLKSKNIKVELFQTKKPDIVFSLNGKSIAIEVETGSVLKNNKKQLIEKVNLLKDGYGDWFFVVTDKNLTTKYAKFGKTYAKWNIKEKLQNYLQSA